MFQCYLDDSGTSGFPVVTMAGFLGHSKQWEHLEPVIDDIMHGANVPIFHAKEFYATKPPFKTWSRIRKQSFTEEIFSVARGRIFGYSATLRKSTVAAGKAKYPSGFSQSSPIGICFAVILNEILTGPMRPHMLDQGLSFLVESGNSNNSNIEQSFHRMAKLPVYGGALRSISFISKENCRAIQLADFFAYFSRRDMVKRDESEGRIAVKANPIMQIIGKHVPIWQRGGYGEPEFVPDKEFKDRHRLV